MKTITLGLLIAAALCSQTATHSSPTEYEIKAVAFLGDPAPGGGAFLNDFEPSRIVNGGDIVFASDVSTGEGIFVARHGKTSQILRSGQDAPGGGTLGGGVLGRIGFNQSGDVVAGFLLDPFTNPVGDNAGVCRFTRSKGTLTAVLKPGNPAPGGGSFVGTFFNMSVNNRGEAVFPGMINGTGVDLAPGPPGIDGSNLGIGLFGANEHSTPFSIVRPGDPAPGGHIFDWAGNGWVNDAGDIAFGAHVKGDPCIDYGTPQTVLIFCGESAYLKKAATGLIQSIAHQGDPAPGGGHYRVAFGPVVNNSGEVVFIGELNAALDGVSFGQSGVFLFSKGTTVAVARPGTSMPGGGHLLSAGGQDSTYFVNDRGSVSFSATLDTTSSINTSGFPDSGVYVFSKGSLQLVARTGTVIRGVGTIMTLGAPGFLASAPTAQYGGVNNEEGQVLFSATFTNGRTALLVATPDE